MKKLLFAFSFLFPISSHSAEMHLSDLSAGMYSYQSPNKIPDNGAASIQNFFTDIQEMAVERNGYTLVDSNVGSNSKSVSALWRFNDNAGNEWIIEYSSRTFYKHTVGNTPTAFGLIATTTNLPRAATNLGKIMFVNGVDTPWTFDGTSTSTISGAPVGSLITAWRTRFVIGNINAAQSTVRFSADGDATSWTIGPNPTDPFAIQIGGANDGYAVKCMGIYDDYLIIQRKYDTWAVSGFDQSDIQNRNVSTDIGCIEPGTNREFDNSYLFLSWRGMEQMTGFIIQPISDPIRNITDVLVKNTVNSRTNIQTTGTDWGAATLRNSLWVDTITASGNLQLTFPDYFDYFRDGTGGTKNVWTKSCYNPFVTCVPNISVANGKITFQSTSGSDEQAITTLNHSVLGTAAGTTFYMLISSITTNIFAGRNTLKLEINTAGTTLVDPNTSGTGAQFVFKSTTSGFFYMNSANSYTSGSVNADGCGISGACTGDIPFSTPLYIWLGTGTYRVTGGSFVSTGTFLCGQINGGMYLIYRDGASGTSSAQVDEFGLAPISIQISSFLAPSATSQILTIGTAITSWGPVTVDDVKTGGTISYKFGSTTTASVSAISNWSSITTGQVPSVSTNPYAAFGIQFSQTVSSGILSVNSFTTTWNEGGIAQPPISINYDRRYWLSLTTTTTSSPVQDTVFVYQRNHTWVMLKGIYAASFALWRDNLLFGDSTTGGNVYQYDTGNSDNGNAISSQIITKSYDMGSHYLDKDFRRSYLTFYGGASGTFSLGFFNEQGTTLYSLGTANMTDGVGQVFEKFHFPIDGSVPLQGRELQYVLTKSGSGDRLKLFDISLDFAPKEAR